MQGTEKDPLNLGVEIFFSFGGIVDSFADICMAKPIKWRLFLLQFVETGNYDHMDRETNWS